MQLTIMPIYQEERRNCTNACLRMVLQFYGLTVSREAIDQFVLKEAGGSFLTEIARFAQVRGFRAECFAYNLLFTDPTDATRSRLALLAKLRRQERTLQDAWYRTTLRSMIACIAAGVQYTIAPLNMHHLKELLNTGIPPIIRVNYTALLGCQGNPLERHAVVVSGYDEDSFSVIDPSDARTRVVTCANLSFAMAEANTTTAGAYLVALRGRRHDVVGRIQPY